MLIYMQMHAAFATALGQGIGLGRGRCPYKTQQLSRPAAFIREGDQSVVLMATCGISTYNEGGKNPICCFSSLLQQSLFAIVFGSVELFQLYLLCMNCYLCLGVCLFCLLALFSPCIGNRFTPIRSLVLGRVGPGDEATQSDTKKNGERNGKKKIKRNGKK